MSKQPAPSRQPQVRRRTKRPLLRIAIEVEGKNAEGQPFTESTYTLVVNRNGARIALKNSLQPGERITITNIQREESCPFRVVERVETVGTEHCEWGVECLEPHRNFWGVYFPEKSPAAPAGEGIDVLIECGTCHAREMAELTMDQYRELSENSALTRACAQCGGDTPWEFGFAEIVVEEPRAGGPQQGASDFVPAEGQERRQAKRFVAMLPLHLRTRDGKEETTRTENLSKLGLCFLSDLAIEEGDVIHLSVGPREDGKQELPARVAWHRRVTPAGRSLYGVRLESDE
jgi:PilZ domain